MLLVATYWPGDATYAGITAVGKSSRACAHLAAAGTVSVWWTRQMTHSTIETSGACADAQLTITATARTLQQIRTALVTRVAIETRRTADLTELTLNARWTAARAVHVVTRAAVLTATDAVAARAKTSLVSTENATIKCVDYKSM